MVQRSQNNYVKQLSSCSWQLTGGQEWLWDSPPAVHLLRRKNFLGRTPSLRLLLDLVFHCIRVIPTDKRPSGSKGEDLVGDAFSSPCAPQTAR